ncbi:MAG: Eco57I restriction-modification methylase domain-containing protein [Candidatus Poseidoniaceae archaeon]
MRLSRLALRNRNPDVLECIANLSSDEVFTPPSIANQMLDSVAEAWSADKDGADIWSDPNVKFLDPCTKSGVFLREIATRLIQGLEDQMPDLQKRVEHILTKQVFGIGITRLTSMLARRSLYCSKNANGEHSVVKSFDDDDGNIWYEPTEHTWKDEKCTYCGASKSTYSRSEQQESHAYMFIHTDDIGQIGSTIFEKPIKFDVVIGNPPYQLSDGGHGRSAKPIYHLFIEQAKKLNPQYLSMITPARWYSGGKGLDQFRKEMIQDKQVRLLVDFENSSEVFPGVDIAGGICFFLWSKNKKRLCKVVNVGSGDPHESERSLDEFPILIRQGRAIPIIRKVWDCEKKQRKLSRVVSPRKPFGLVGNYPPKSSGIPCHFTQKIGLKYAAKEDVVDPNNFIDKWKLLIPRAPIAGQTDFSKPVGFYYDGNVVIAKPGECCTESWLVAYTANSKQEIESFKSYLFTKMVRFLLLQAVVSQDISREKFFLIPEMDDYNCKYTDKMLRKRWNISQEEWLFVDSKIKTIGDVDE